MARDSGMRGGAENSKGRAGFTLVELLVTVTVAGIVASVAMPLLNKYYGGSCVKAVIYEIAGMMKEAKQRALTADSYHAVCFNTGNGRISLVSGRGPDGKWNTADDQLVRSFRLADKGGGVSFGYGGCGPIPGYAATTDGVTFQSNKTAVCNPDLTGNAGTVYVRSGSAFMAIVLNSQDFSYALWRWNGIKWERL
jgi:prepilin-type N-terminal cleavage/methylation domain-containing protein